MTADKASAPADGLVNGVNSPFNACCYRDTCRAQAATITRLSADLEEARGLLEPFARAADKLDGLWANDDCRWNDPTRSGVTVAHIRAARAFLTRTEPRHD